MVTFFYEPLHRRIELDDSTRRAYLDHSRSSYHSGRSTSQTVLISNCHPLLGTRMPISGGRYSGSRQIYPFERITLTLHRRLLLAHDFDCDRDEKISLSRAWVVSLYFRLCSLISYSERLYKCPFLLSHGTFCCKDHARLHSTA